MSVKINPKYKPLYNAGSRYNIITGGRGSGKSFEITLFLLLLTFEVGHKILFTRLTMSSADTSIIPEVVSKIELLGLSDCFRITKSEIINKQSGSSILFKGIRASNGDQTARLKSLNDITTFVIEEAEELLSEATFDKINLSVRTKKQKNRTILVLNPATKTHWIYERFFKQKGVNEGFNGTKGNTSYIHTTYLDNKHNSEDYYEEMKFIKENDSEKYHHIVLGGWLEKSEGVIFTNWKYGKFPTDVDTQFGADWGYSIDPSTLVEVYVDKKNREIYLREHLYKKGLNTSELINIFKDKAGSKLIVADSAEGRLIDEMYNDGVNIRRCKKGAGSIKEGIMLMKDYRLIVDFNSGNLASELNNYSWKESGETPIDRNNHIIDAARYAITDILKEASGIYFIY